MSLAMGEVTWIGIERKDFGGNWNCRDTYTLVVVPITGQTAAMIAMVSQICGDSNGGGGGGGGWIRWFLGQGVR